MNTHNQVSEQPDYRLRSLQSSGWWTSIPFIAGVAVLLFIIWTSMQILVYPHDGIGNLNPSGKITAIDPNGPASNILEDGDIILEIDRVPWKEEFPPYAGRQGGDQIELLVDRNGELVTATIALIDPSIREIATRFVPILVALVFWVIGMGVQTFKPSDGAADLFFSWCQMSAMTLAAGAASYLAAVWVSMLFNSLVWLLGPHSVHFHTAFPQPTTILGKRKWLAALYFIAALGIVSIFLTGLLDVSNQEWISSLASFSRLYLGINMLLVVALLYYNYNHSDTPGARGKVRIVALGGGLSGISIVILTILPDALFHQPILPYQFAFFLLAIIPVTYGFAIYRLHLIEIERYVNRGATNFLSYIILGGVYLILYALFSRILPPEIGNNPIVNAVIVLLLVILFSPLRKWVQRFVDTVFYGNWYDYRLGVMNVTRDLEDINDLHDLARTVSDRLVNTLNLEESCAFLLGLDGNFSIIHVATRSGVADQPMRNYPVLPNTSLTYLLKLGAIERDNLRQALSAITVTPEELHLLNSEQIHLWVPIIGHAQILGLLALGPKLGGDVFSGEDLDILRILARQMGSIIENLHLLTRLRQHAAELEIRVQERTEELYNSKERVEAILASVGDGVIVIDLEFKIMTVNPAFERQTGYPSSQVISKKFDTILVKEDRPDLLTEITSTLKQGRMWSGEISSQRKSGEQFDIQMTIAPVHDRNGRIMSYVGSLFDITHQKELERMKDTFVADVSHELRTPTTNIRLYLELLNDATIEKQKQYIAVVQDQSSQLVKLVEDILDLSRLTRVRAQTSSFSELHLNVLAAQIMESHQPLTTASGIELIFEPDPDLQPIVGSHEQVTRLITNLISNAVRYTLDGEVRLVTRQCEDKAVLEVSDTGIGIKAEDLPHIFERFYRGGNVRLSRIPGTGLGLAIVKEIVDLHEGGLEVESELGKGTLFKVWFPTMHTVEELKIEA